MTLNHVHGHSSIAITDDAMKVDSVSTMMRKRFSLGIKKKKKKEHCLLVFWSLNLISIQVSTSIYLD